MCCQFEVRRTRAVLCCLTPEANDEPLALPHCIQFNEGRVFSLHRVHMHLLVPVRACYPLVANALAASSAAFYTSRYRRDVNSNIILGIVSST